MASHVERHATAGMIDIPEPRGVRRIDAALSQVAHADGNGTTASQVKRDLTVARYYLQTADRRVNQALLSLWSNDDEATTATADVVLNG